MATWNKIKFYYDSIPGAEGSVLTATSEAAGCPASNIHNMLEVNRWAATDSAGPQYLTVDCGVGMERTADYVAIFGHNLGSIGASVSLQYSTDNFSADVNDAFAPEAVPADSVYLKEFTPPGARRYWRLKINGHTGAPYIAVCVWGNKTELDYATSGFDPYGEEVRCNENLSQGGFVSGVHVKYAERSFSIRFEDADSALYGKVRQWWEVSGLKNFFVAWEASNAPGDVFLMRPDVKFRNPLKNGGLYRDITINIKGRKG
ncbi:MAG: hypothetical protein HY893_03570 [Deltaproteobacteria bacterium]|nr:hypothetical protein [Deltaproteobacteria bacterium]